MVFAGVSHTVDHRLHQGMVGIGHEDAVEGRHAPRFLVESRPLRALIMSSRLEVVPSVVSGAVVSELPFSIYFSTS